MRSVIITGVSRGLGSALFDQFRAAGDRILALGRRFTDEQHALARTEPQRIRLRQVDLAYPTSLPTAAELASFVHDGGDVVLVHNAAIVDPVGAVGTLAPEQIHLAVSVNLTAPMLLTNALLGAGAVARCLTVLFVSSGAAHRPVGGWAVYGATKRGGESFFDALATQYADDPRVRVVNVQPGVVDTDMQARIREYARSDAYFPEREQFIGLHERGELAVPADTARRIIADHLAS